MRIRWRGLELPSQVIADRATLTGTYGKFVVGTVRARRVRRDRGQQPAARCSSPAWRAATPVTQIKVHGAQHEFTTLEGVKEDVTDIVLNVKSLVVKNHSEQTKVVEIEKTTRGPITGADVEPTTRSR